MWWPYKIAIPGSSNPADTAEQWKISVAVPTRMICATRRSRDVNAAGDTLISVKSITTNEHSSSQKQVVESLLLLWDKEEQVQRTLFGSTYQAQESARAAAERKIISQNAAFARAAARAGSCHSPATGGCCDCADRFHTNIKFWWPQSISSLCRRGAAGRDMYGGGNCGQGCCSRDARFCIFCGTATAGVGSSCARWSACSSMSCTLSGWSSACYRGSGFLLFGCGGCAFTASRSGECDRRDVLICTCACRGFSGSG